MNDEELPINDELASAYLDDELDSVARATASADPNVMAIVESFARVRSALGDAEPVAESVKDAALAAALTEFISLHGVTAAAPSATVTSLESRRRTYRVLTSVAAAVAVLAIGVAAINGSGGDSKSSSAVERDTSTAGSILSSSADAPSLKVAIDAGAPAGTAAPSGAAETVAAASATAPGGATAGATFAAPPKIDTRAALIEYAASIERVASATPQAPTTAQTENVFGSEHVPCLTSHQVVLGGPITVDGTLAYAVRDTSNGSVQAIDAADCKVLL